MDLNNHKFIILASYTANALGQIRSLGERGISPIAVLVHKNTFRIDKSKYIGELYNVKSIEDGLDLIIERFGNEPNKPFLFTDRDDVMGLIDRRYNELIEKFNIWNAGESGKYQAAQDNSDVFKYIQEEYEKGWYIPSMGEWAAFGDYFTNKTNLETKLTTSNYYNVFGLDRGYWTSSIGYKAAAYFATFEFGDMHYMTINSTSPVRLGATF